MKQAFLNRKYNQGRLILIYAGWGSDMSLYEHINMPGWDTMLCWDYDDFSFDVAMIKDYHTIYLYAWSLGVFAATQSLKDVRLAKAIAINGTMLPVSDDYGIPIDIYKGTLESLNDRNLVKFQMRMFENSTEYKKYIELLPLKNDIDKLKQQLRNVQESLPTKQTMNWTYAFVSRNDRIFPFENQKKAWTGASDIIEIDKPHFVDINEIIKTTIILQEQVASRFSKSMCTYNENAQAQNIIAQQLAEKLKKSGKRQGKSLLEIGSGTGLFTNRYAQIIDVDEATLIDLCEIPQHKFTEKLRNIKADAEQWLEHLTEDVKFDFILSASTIQWFVDIDRFFRNCKLHLSENGVLCISTFIAGNLYELDEFRVSPIKYYSVEQYTDILKRYFDKFSVYEDKIELSFDSPQDVLKHLRLTGVTASGKKSNITDLKRLIANYPKTASGHYVLTYRPIYIYVENN